MQWQAKNGGELGNCKRMRESNLESSYYGTMHSGDESACFCFLMNIFDSAADRKETDETTKSLGYHAG